MKPVKMIIKYEYPVQKKDKNTVYIIKRTDGGFGKPEMYLSLEGGLDNAKRNKNWYKENIKDGRTWDKEHYLVKCRIIEEEVISV